MQGNNISNAFKVDRDLRQGDPLSTLIFNLGLEKIILALGINIPGTIYNKNHQCISCADDIALKAK